MIEYSKNKGKTVDLNMCVGRDLAKSKIENGVYPIVIYGDIESDFLREYGNFYVRYADHNQIFDDKISILEPAEGLNVQSLILKDDPDFRLLVAVEEYRSNDAIYTGNDGQKYRVGEYVNSILEQLQIEQNQGRTR